MANYYFDCEFIEDFEPRSFHIPDFKWKKPKHYVELISIGIVSEDNREYYAVSKDFDLKHVWNKYDLQLPDSMGDEPKKIYWLRENVLRPIHEDLCKNISGDMKNTDYFNDLSEFSYKNLKRLIAIYGKTNKQIASDIRVFVADMEPGPDVTKPRVDELHAAYDQMTVARNPTFYAYYADYDWVVFCSLFGRMLNLPKGFPMYCHDLKQDMDVIRFTKAWKDEFVPGDNEHHALADARWNKKLHETIRKHAEDVYNGKRLAAYKQIP